MTETFATEIDLAAGEAAACDLRQATFPLGWSCRADGAACAVHGANTARPNATDWTPSAETPTVAAGENDRDTEPTPVAWLRFSAGSGGTARVGIAAAGRVLAHKSTDALAADGSIADISGLEAGDRLRRGLDALFAYAGPAGPPALSYTVASGDATKATATIVDGGFVEVVAVATGSAAITVTARAPAGQTATLSFNVTVA